MVVAFSGLAGGFGELSLLNILHSPPCLLTRPERSEFVQCLQMLWGGVVRLIPPHPVPSGCFPKRLRACDSVSKC